MRLVKIFFIIFSITSLQAANLHESKLGIENSDYLRNQVKEFFYDESGFSQTKLKEFEKLNIKDRAEEIKLLFDNLVTKEGLSAEEANAKVLKDKKILSIDYILANLDSLKNNSEPENAGYQLKNILRVYLALKKEARDDPFVHGMKALGSMLFHRYSIPLNDLKKKMPSNLANMNEGRYFTHQELESLVKNGEDLSLLNPADSTFWKKPLEISTKDPITEMEREGKVPKVFKFGEILTREGHPKLEVTEKSSNGVKRKWRMKFGREVNNEIFVSRLMNLLGYYSDEYYLTRDVKIYFKNKKEYEDMLLAWIDFYNNGIDVKPSRYIKATGEDENGFFAVFYEGLLELRPKNEYRVGDFHVTEMGNWERREVRAVLMLMALVNNPDFKPSRNNRVKLIDNGDDLTKWEVQELVHDLGFAFGGQFVSNAPNQYKWSFIKRRGNKIKIDYINNQPVTRDRNPFLNVTYSDLKWIARMLVQVTPEQLEQIAFYSGWPKEVAKLNLEKLKKRRNEIVEAFELENKTIDGNLIQLWPEVDPKTFSWGEFIKDGKIIKEYKPEGYPIDYIKIDYEPEIIVQLGKFIIPILGGATDGIPYYRMTGLNELDISGFGFQKIIPGVGFGFRISRQVEANPGATDENKAWVTHDTLDIFADAAAIGVIPVTTGMDFKIKFEVLIGKQFSVSYYSPTPLKAIAGNPKLIAELAFKKKKIIENLKSGETYSDGLFVEFKAKQGIQTSGLSGVGVGIKQEKFFLNFSEVKKGENNKMEVTKGKSKSFTFSTAAYVELFEILKIDLIKAGIKFGDKKTITYHFNLNDSSSFEEREAFQIAAFTNNKDDSILEKIPTSKSEVRYYEKFWSVGAFATIGGNTSGFYNVNEDVDGNISRSFDYKTKLETSTPVKNIKYNLLGHLEFSDDDFSELTKQNIALEYEALYPQMSFKAMKDQTSHINALVNDKIFLQYTPEYHAINHLGKTIINLRFDLKDDALSCIFEKTKCLAKGPSASRIDRKLKHIRDQRTPIKRVEKLGPYLRNMLIKPEDFKDFLQFVGGEKFSTELWIDSDVISRDRYIHNRKEFLTI